GERRRLLARRARRRGRLARRGRGAAGARMSLAGVARAEERRPARGDLLDLELAEIDERGRMLGHVEGYTVAVRGGALGARVRARVQKRRRNRIEAVIVEEREPSPHAASARCPHVASCGGCSFQELAYAAQLAAKERLLARILAPLAAARIES